MGLTLMVIGAIVLVYAWGVERAASSSAARAWVLFASLAAAGVILVRAAPEAMSNAF